MTAHIRHARAVMRAATTRSTTHPGTTNPAPHAPREGDHS